MPHTRALEDQPPRCRGRFGNGIMSNNGALTIFAAVIAWNGAVTTAYAMWAQSRGQTVVAPSVVSVPIPAITQPIMDRSSELLRSATDVADGMLQMACCRWHVADGSEGWLSVACRRCMVPRTILMPVMVIRARGCILWTGEPGILNAAAFVDLLRGGVPQGGFDVIMSSCHHVMYMARRDDRARGGLNGWRGKRTQPCAWLTLVHNAKLG